MPKKDDETKKKAPKAPKELKDYSGPVRPICRLEDLGKDMLVKLANEYARAYQQMDNLVRRYSQEVRGGGRPRNRL
jgi:hypothetical protein